MIPLRKILLTGLGTGYLRPASGTWGSAAACGAAFGLLAIAGHCFWTVSVGLAAIAILSTIGCVAFGRYGEKAFGKKDPSQVTLDEWAGQALALIALPFGGTWKQRGIAVGIGFVLFRLFDIVKPPPARQLEKLPHGWGVSMDDLAAGLYANIAAQLILRLGFGYGT